MTLERRIQRLINEAADLSLAGDQLASLRCADMAHRLLEEERQARFNALIERLRTKESEGGS